MSVIGGGTTWAKPGQAESPAYSSPVQKARLGPDSLSVWALDVPTT